MRLRLPVLIWPQFVAIAMAKSELLFRLRSCKTHAMLSWGKLAELVPWYQNYTIGGENDHAQSWRTDTDKQHA